MLICFERKVLLAGCWWLVDLREKYCWLVADKPNEDNSLIPQSDIWHFQKSNAFLLAIVS
jgi:hypothetical protein